MFQIIETTRNTTVEEAYAVRTDAQKRCDDLNYLASNNTWDDRDFQVING